ncbi:MAG: hypothetical protein IJJ86_02990 [Clostridia bacterium]|nr:hypothetical protein [Clostridia bacterium]
MKRFVTWLLIAILALMPLTAFAEGEDTGDALSVDEAHVYSDMDRSISEGYHPRVSSTAVHFRLPLIGETDGSPVEVTAKLPTDGPFTVDEIRFTVPQQTFEFKNTKNEKETVKAYVIEQSIPLKQMFFNGTYSVRFVVSYRTAAGEPKEQTFVQQTVMKNGKTEDQVRHQDPIRKPVLVIREDAITPTEVVGNDRVTVRLKIENVGQKEARNIRINAAPQDGDLVLTGDLNGYFIECLNANETIEAEFTLRVASHALEGDHLVQINISYEGQYEGDYSETALYCVHAAQPVELAFDAVELPESMTSGDTFTQIIYVYNPSCATAYNVRGVLTMDGLICSSAFLGTIAPQGEATKELSVFITTLSGSQKYGETWGNFELHFEDENGEEHVLYQDLKGTIQEPEKITDEEKARQEQEQKEQQTLSQWWISLLVAIAVIIILIAVIVIARFGRMLRMK